MSGTVVIGAGQAASQLVASLRAEGYAQPITVIGDEAYPPYQRPPLSKKFLSGELEEERLYIKPPEFYAQADTTLVLGGRVEAVDLGPRTVTLANGDSFPYETLVFATGSRVRKLTVPGAELPGIFYLRGIADVNAIRPHFEPGKHLVIVGGGYIGLETAAVAAKRGLKVTVVEAMERCLQRVTSKLMSDFFQEVHHAAGVTILTSTGVHGFEAGEGGQIVVKNAGDDLVADLVIAGIGILPEQALAQSAGLVCENGIVVDEFARTSDPNVYAAGDCANLPSKLLGRRLRLESVHNAIEQAKTAALAIVGKPKPYDDVPWFWSDQYELKLQIAGISQPEDEVVLRGDPATRKFAAFYLRNGAVAAVDAINAAPEYMIGRMMIAQNKTVDPARLADLAVPMKSFMS
ncbi:Dicamba O-demethylase 1, ferredoxin reductase component [Alphaproteobacteria bacterium SO-S41]|nr:Dicamba O-demethylase 1, ferredoxin reductase component [Alphaproteobacteria bacterium SO-S41]